MSLCLFVSLFYFAFLSVLFCVCADDVNVVVLLLYCRFSIYNCFCGVWDLGVSRMAFT